MPAFNIVCYSFFFLVAGGGRQRGAVEREVGQGLSSESELVCYFERLEGGELPVGVDERVERRVAAALVKDLVLA